MTLPQPSYRNIHVSQRMHPQTPILTSNLGWLQINLLNLHPLLSQQQSTDFWGKSKTDESASCTSEILAILVYFSDLLLSQTDQSWIQCLWAFECDCCGSKEEEGGGMKQGTETQVFLTSLGEAALQKWSRSIHENCVFPDVWLWYCPCQFTVPVHRYECHYRYTDYTTGS